MPRVAQQERRALCDTFETVGPDAATLCEGWRTRDLAAHLLLRETRPDAAVGIVVGPLSRYTDAVMRRTATKPWPQLVDSIRSGPPRLSLFGLPGVDEAANVGEFFIHHEDVLRAVDPAARRPLSPDLERGLWTALPRVSRLTLRTSPVGVQAVSEGFGAVTLRGAQGGRSITLTGRPGEIFLQAYGRASNAPGLVDVQIDGSPEDVAAYAATTPGI